MPIPIKISQRREWAIGQLKKKAKELLWSLFLGFIFGLGFMLGARILR